MKRRGFLKTLCGTVTAAFVARELPQPPANLYGARKIDVPFQPDLSRPVEQEFSYSDFISYKTKPRAPHYIVFQEQIDAYNRVRTGNEPEMKA